MTRFIMMCGLPGSGKSTYAKCYALHNDFKVCSSDEIRERLFGSRTVQDHNDEVFKVLHKEIKQYLRNGQNVIYDACNVHSKYRIAFLNEINKIPCTKEVHVIVRPYEVCLRQNWQRELKVPDAIIRKFYMNWNTPYYFEGWDKIELVRNAEDVRADIILHHVKYVYNNYINYNQNNSYHDLTLGEHMIRTMYKVAIDGCEDYTALAGLFHDIGKPFARYDSENGSHYYNHENVGAYDFLTFGYEDELSLKVSFLINNHMKPIHWNSCEDPEKLHNKYRRLWGSDLYDRVMLLHKVDISSK